MWYGLAIDLVLIALLVPTIAYCGLVHRRLSTWRAAESQMTTLIARFNDATARAELGIAQLKSAAEAAARGLEPKVAEARALIDDLDALNARANRLATALERNGGAPISPALVTPMIGAEDRRPVREGARSRHETELLKALREAK